MPLTSIPYGLFDAAVVIGRRVLLKLSGISAAELSFGWYLLLKPCCL
jgi:hypothetical protein